MEGKQETAPQCKRGTLRTELEVQPEEGLRKPFRIKRVWGAGEVAEYLRGLLQRT